MRRIRYILGWLLVRPRRWLFLNMVWSSDLEILPDRSWDGSVRWPNVHWWLLYKTVFRFFKWLDWEAWRPLCTWENGRLKHKPWYARVIQRIGETTAGGAISCFECYHCGSKDGCQSELSQSDDHFELLKTWTSASQDGMDYRFCGITTCPDCGYKSEYEDGSL